MLEYCSIFKSLSGYFLPDEIRLNRWLNDQIKTWKEFCFKSGIILQLSRVRLRLNPVNIFRKLYIFDSFTSCFFLFIFFFTEAAVTQWPSETPQVFVSYALSKEKITQLQPNPVHSFPQISPNKALLMHHLTPNMWPFGQQADLPAPSFLLQEGVKTCPYPPQGMLGKERPPHLSKTSGRKGGGEEAGGRKEKHSFIGQKDRGAGGERKKGMMTEKML